MVLLHRTKWLPELEQEILLTASLISLKPSLSWPILALRWAIQGRHGPLVISIFSVCLWIMDLDSRIKAKKCRPLIWDATNIYRAFRTRTVLPVRRLQRDPSSHWRIWWFPDPDEDTETKMCRPCFKVFWLSKGSSTGHSDRKKKRRWEDNFKEWTRMD